MKSLTCTIILGAFTLLAGLTQTRALDAVVIVNESVSVTSITKDMLRDLYTGKTAYWDGGASVIIVVFTDKTDAALQEVSGMSTSAFRTFWQRLTFSGRGKQPKEADTIEKVMGLVAENKGAIALAPANAELKGVKKVEVK